MVVNRPSVFIYTNQADPALLKEICAGIEEEGVFFEVLPSEIKDQDELADRAANDSMTGSGIGVSGNNVAFIMKGLKKGSNIDVLNTPDGRELRRIGANSARAVKKLALR